MKDAVVEIERRNPFPGPVALSHDDAVFGRDEEINRLQGLLVSERVVVLYGVSGAGKSSVLAGRGGLRDRFERDGSFSVLGPVEFRLPDTRDVNEEQFYERFLVGQLCKEEPEEHRIKDPQIMRMLGLGGFLARRRRYLKQPYQLLILDQFEEIFTKLVHDEPAKRLFFKLLGELIERDSSLWLLLAMREEYIAELDHYRRLVPGRFRTGFRLELMSNESARTAVEATARGASPSIRICEENLRDFVENLSRVRVIDADGRQVHTPGQYVEPLFLQLACRDAWPKVRDELDKDGGKKDCYALQRDIRDANLDEVLLRFIDSELKGIEKDFPAVAYKVRVFLEDGLISGKGLRNLVSAEQASEEFGLQERLLARLLRTRLIRPQIRHQISYFELAHDRLVEPIRESNQRWLLSPDQPAWRRTARKWKLAAGDSRNYPIPLLDLFAARRALKQHKDALAPFERAFIREKSREKWRRFVYPVAYLATMAILTLIVTLIVNREAQEQIRENQTATAKALERAEASEGKALDALERARKSEAAAADAQTKAEVALDEAERSEAAAKASKENAEKLRQRLAQSVLRRETINTELGRERTSGAVRALLSGYTQRKWRERRDQAAVLQVSHAHREARERLSGKDFQGLRGALFSAYNNVFFPDDRAFGFSRTLPRVRHDPGLIAFYGGPEPAAAYVQGGSRLFIERLDSKAGGSAPTRERDLDSALGPVKALAFSPDGRSLILIAERQVARLDLGWGGADAGSLPGPAHLTGHTDGQRRKLQRHGVSALAFSPNGRELVYASGASVWRLCLDAAPSRHACGQVSPEGKLHGTVSALAVLDRGEEAPLIAYGTTHGDVGIRDWGTKRWLAYFEPPERKYETPIPESKKVINLAFRPPSADVPRDHPSLVVVHENTLKFLLDWRAVKTVKENRERVTWYGIFDEERPPDGRSEERYFRIPIRRDPGSRYYGSKEEYDDSEYPAAFITADGEELYALFEDSLERWILSTKWATSRDDEPYYVPMKAFDTGARNLRHLTVGTDYVLAEGFFYRWSWETGESRRVSKMLAIESEPRYGGKYFYPYHIRFGPDDWFLTASSNFAVERFRVDEQGRPSRRQPVLVCGRGIASARSLSLSPDGNHVAAGMAKGAVAFGPLSRGTGNWCDQRAHQRRCRQDGRQESNGLWATAFSSDGAWLASGDYAGRVVLWSLGNGLDPVKTETQELGRADRSEACGDWIRSLTFSPRAEVLIVGTNSGAIYAFAVAHSGTLIPVTPPAMQGEDSIGPVFDLSFSADGSLLAAAGGFGPIRIWSVGDAGEGVPAFTPQAMLSGHAGGTRSIEFNPRSEKELLSGGADGLIQVWNPGNPAALPATLRSYDSDVLTVSWAPDGKRIVSGHKDGRLLVWDWSLERFGRIACDLVWRELSADEWADWFKPLAAGAHRPVCSAAREQP
jgi:WD40 repeat protein